MAEPQIPALNNTPPVPLKNESDSSIQTTPSSTEKNIEVKIIPKITNINPNNKLSIPSKKKIMCKFFIMGNCTKGENCIYLHSETEKNKRIINTPIIECPMYNLGYCKNGPLCKYKHVKREKKENIENDDEILPIWYIEHYFDKPISVIFNELEKTKSVEVQNIQRKYGIIEKTQNQFYQNNNYPFDIYGEKKDSIEYTLNDQRNNISYFLIRCNKFEKIKISMENNEIDITSEFIRKIMSKSNNKNDICIGIVFDEENKNYMGFLKFKHIVEKNTMKVEWMWRTKLHYSKLSHLINKKDNDNYFINASNGCMIDNELGNYLCRMMIKRLSKEEVREFMQEKKLFEQENEFNRNTRSKEPNIHATKMNNLHVNINHHNYTSNYHDTSNKNNYYIHHKRERGHSHNGYKYEDSYYDEKYNYRDNNSKYYKDNTNNQYKSYNSFSNSKKNKYNNSYESSNKKYYKNYHQNHHYQKY